jgi:predicted DNA-binding transcriptional regulator AlpA
MSLHQEQSALLKVQQLAALLQVSVRSVWRMRSAGKLPRPVEVGGSTRWSRAVIQQWIDRGCPDPSDACCAEGCTESFTVATRKQAE